MVLQNSQTFCSFSFKLLGWGIIVRRDDTTLVAGLGKAMEFLVCVIVVFAELMMANIGKIDIVQN